MKKILFVLVSVLLLINYSIGHAESDADYQIRKAKSLIESGDYDLAQRRLKKIAQNFDYPESIKREASYYIGFCHVKNGDPWRATEAFEDFLLSYDNGSKRFVPDALYVMGRAYEEIGEIRKAKRAYSQVVDEFYGSDFARKARLRLKEIGGSDYSNNNGGSHSDPYHDDYNNNGGHSHGDTYGVSREIRMVLRHARTYNNSYLKDQYLFENINRSENGSDLVALISLMDNDVLKGQFCDKIWSLRFAKTLNAATIVEIASKNRNSYLADQFLLEAAQKIDFRIGGYSTLAEACTNSYIRSQILEIAKDNVSNNNGGGHNNGGYGSGDYGHGSNGVSREVREIIRLAKMENNSYSRDQFILNSAGKGKSGSDFIAMLAEMSNDAIKGQFLDAIQRNRVFKTLSARSVTDIAAEVSNSYTSDQFLLEAAKSIPFTMRDYRILAEACSNGYTRSEILRIAEKSNYGHSGGHGYRTEAVLNDLEKPLPTDPFVSYNFNKAQVKRINSFIKAVDTKKGMNEAVRNLKTADMKILTVKEYMKKYQKIMEFDRLHNSN